MWILSVEQAPEGNDFKKHSMKYSLIALFFFTIKILSGQSFEGTLTYVTDLEISENVLKMGMSKQLLIDKMKEDGSWSDTLIVSYKGGNYYGLLNRNSKSCGFYNAGTNKIYAISGGETAELCTVTDASVDLQYVKTGKMPVIKKLDTVVKVNGIDCSIVRVEWTAGTNDYYYNSSKLIVDPALYSKHVYEGWAEYLKISKALPLKIVKEVKGMMKITQTLISEKKEHIDDRLFAVPELIADKGLNPFQIGNREIMRIKK